MKSLVLVLLVAACNKPPNADCEGLKARYLAWSDAQTREALANDAPEDHAKDELDAAKEHAAADAKFIGVCNEIKLDPTCWAKDLDQSKRAACKPIQHELETKLYR